MISENATVTLPLENFDELREGHAAFKVITSRIASCFDYALKDNYTEILTVDVERLISATKGYALWKKEIETDIDAIQIKRKEGAV